MLSLEIIKRVLIVSFFVAATFAEAKSFKVNTAHSSVKFKVKCMVVGTITGKFSQFHGKYNFENGKLKSFNAVCYTDSINTGNKKRDKNLKSAYFFNSSSFPKMTLKLVHQKKNNLFLKITIKGLSKTVAFNYIPNSKLMSRPDKHLSGFLIQGKIYLKDFNLNMNKAIGPSGMVLGKTVKIIVNIEGEEYYELADYINSAVENIKETINAK